MSAKLFEGTDHAELYKYYRSSIPKHVVDKIFEYVKEKVQGPLHHIVDVGCGSGQGSELFAPHFEKYTGVDTSEAQIAQAIKTNKLPNAEFLVANAEQLPFEDNSVTLINVHLAIHWFDRLQFFAEANRILAPNGAIAISGYLLPIPGSDKGDSDRMKILMDQLWRQAMEPYHHPALINYSDIYDLEKTDYPFQDLVKINLPFTRTVPLKLAFGYITSWSSYQTFKKREPEKLETVMNKFKSEFTEAAGVQLEDDNITLKYSDLSVILGRKNAA